MITIKGSNYSGTITPPSSKSDAHRALICAALSNCASHLLNVSMSNDIEATLVSMKAMGANISLKENEIFTEPIKERVSKTTLEVNESGSTLRFLIPLSLVLCEESHFVLKGNLINRPIDSFIETFKDQNVSITKVEDGYIVKGSLKSGTYTISGNVSSQFISGLLFALPLLDGDSKIVITNEISSLNYILMTIDSLSKFGISVHFDMEKQIIEVKGNQVYQGCEYKVENDYSQAAFFLALGAINDSLTIKGMNLFSYQADKNVLPIMDEMGVALAVCDDKIMVMKSILEGATISLDENPDLGPILIGLSTFATSDTKFTNIKRLRIKESDRIEAMRYNLDLLGIKTECPDEDTLIVHPGIIQTPTKTLSSFHDHRIFMTLCVITSKLDEITIDDELCINKSYPKFFEDLASIKED